MEYDNGIRTIKDVAVQSELKPVSFEKQKELTKGQKMLVELLIQKAKDGEVLKREEIRKLWLSVETRYYRTWAYHGAYVDKESIMRVKEQIK